MGDTTHNPTRGQKHPLGHVPRQRASSPETFGGDMVVLGARWNRLRLPGAMAARDPARTGHQTILFRQRLKDFEPPAWVHEVVVVADAGSPANAPLKRIEALEWTDVFAMLRPRTFTHGKYVRDVVHHLPTSPYRRRATSKPAGRRQDDGVLMRQAAWPQLGAVTIGLSKKRRHVGPTRVTSIVTTLLEASASAMLSQYAMRWGVELTIKELKGGRHVGRMQVSQEADRVERSVMLPVCADLLVVRLYGAEEQRGKNWSLFQLKQQCAEAFMQDQVHRVEQKWLRKWRQIRKAA